MYLFIKRLIDISFSLIGLMLVLPILIIVIVTILISMDLPIFFKQKRPGLNGEPFKFYKFRTMSNKKDKDGNLLSDKLRLTSFGIFLRKTSLDELPQLFNVLKGDMSLVGPRPLLMEYLPLYSKDQMRRHKVKPGITGWAQINGRNAISWEEKFELDVWYVDNKSLLPDFKILLKTVWKVLKRDGINNANHITMEKFKGGLNMNAEKSRFNNWEYPEIKDGKPTKYNWVVQSVDELKLGYKTDIGAFTYINAKYGVTIENDVQIGSHCSIYSVSTIDDTSGKVLLKKNCRIGSHSTILPGVIIGKNSIIGAHSLVTKSIPDNVVAIGVPAKVIKNINE